MPKLGIDFGTTNSLAVAYDKKEHQFHYFNYIGSKVVPTSSTVWYHDNKIEIGKVARDNINKFSDVDGHHFEKSIKSSFGTDTNRYVFGKPVKPHEIASLIIKELKDNAIKNQAEEIGIDMSKAVFTVPINFSGKARNDLRKSANDAGLEVSTFIHEPFAAIIGYYFTSIQTSYDDVLSKLRSLDGQYLLTFDWGGGTLDITVVKVEGGKMKEVGTAELSGIAGDEFDKKIANFVWNKFCDKVSENYSRAELEKIKNEKWDRLLANAERCKIDLSTREETDFYVDYITEDDDIDEIVSQDDLNELLNDSLELANSRISEALKTAGIDANEISHVLLTGGTCYIPAVQEKMKKRFGHRVEIVKDADLVIAQGAAVISELGWLPFLTKDILVELCDDSYWAMFEKGTPVAAEKDAERSEVFTCVDQRKDIAKIIICEGTDQQKDKNLAILNVPVLGDHRFGDDIYVQATLDKDIVLTIKAHSKMVMGYDERTENYSIQKTAKIHQLCFGLSFEV